MPGGRAYTKENGRKKSQPDKGWISHYGGVQFTTEQIAIGASEHWCLLLRVFGIVARGLDLLEYPVKVTLKKPVLHNAVFFEFAFSVRPRHFGTDLAGVLQDIALGELKKASRRLAQSSMVMGILRCARSSARSR